MTRDKEKGQERKRERMFMTHDNQTKRHHTEKHDRRETNAPTEYVDDTREQPT